MEELVKASKTHVTLLHLTAPQLTRLKREATLTKPSLAPHWVLMRFEAAAVTTVAQNSCVTGRVLVRARKAKVATFSSYCGQPGMRLMRILSRLHRMSSS